MDAGERGCDSIIWPWLWAFWRIAPPDTWVLRLPDGALQAPFHAFRWLCGRGLVRAPAGVGQESVVSGVATSAGMIRAVAAPSLVMKHLVCLAGFIAASGHAQEAAS